MKLIGHFRTLTRFELCLWLGSVIVITVSFVLFGSSGILTLIASLVGATALIFVSKGNVLGQMLTVIFSLLYAVISYDLKYYGEMITYLGMTSPIAVMSVIEWLKHPFESGKAEVKIACLSKKQCTVMLISTAIVTAVFYFILAALDTSILSISTVSIATSFLASYLMLSRSPSYAIAYAANDAVLVTLWVIASISDISYLPMALCFVIFFVNDSYGFLNWRRMMKRQQQNAS